jgi:hypothetical protein
MGCPQLHNKKMHYTAKGVQGLFVGFKKSDAKSYRWGFNGQQREDEIAGEGNHNTAKFWEYDSRLGRRWNLDPKPQIGNSDYGVNRNNPIISVDKNGDVVTFIGGFAVGFLGDIASQMMINAATGKNVFEIDWADALVSGTMGALTSGASALKIVAKTSAKLATAAGISGNMVKTSFKIGMKVTEEGIKASMDVKIKTDVEGSLDVDFKSVFGSGETKKLGTDALVDFGVGMTMNSIQKGVSNTFTTYATGYMKKEQSQLFNKIRKSMLGGKKWKEYNANYQQLGNDIKFNKKVSKGMSKPTKDLIDSGTKDKQEEIKFKPYTPN